MRNVEIRRMGLMELVELKNKKEQSLWSLGFRLAPRELFDIIVELEKEIELRLEQVRELKTMAIIDLLPGMTQETVDEIYNLLEKKEFEMWLND